VSLLVLVKSIHQVLWPKTLGRQACAYFGTYEEPIQASLAQNPRPREVAQLMSILALIRSPYQIVMPGLYYYYSSSSGGRLARA
jgi:hypothetical protein